MAEDGQAQFVCYFATGDAFRRRSGYGRQIFVSWVIITPCVDGWARLGVLHSAHTERKRIIRKNLANATVAARQYQKAVSVLDGSDKIEFVEQGDKLNRKSSDNTDEHQLNQMMLIETIYRKSVSGNVYMAWKMDWEFPKKST